MNKYEAMFLFDPAFSPEWDKIQAEVDRLMQRAEAKLIVCGKWDERRLAYEIRGCKRAIYVLAYFEAAPDRISGMERDVQLSESCLRCLVLRADHLTEEQMREATTSPCHGNVPESMAGEHYRRGQGDRPERPHHGAAKGGDAEGRAGTAAEEPPAELDDAIDLA